MITPLRLFNHSLTDTEQLLRAIENLARDVGDFLRAHEISHTQVKADGSPVSSADHGAEAIIVAALLQLTPNIPIIAEEQFSQGNVPSIAGGIFWLVDALDGTKEYLKASPDYTVNIALVEDGIPALGVIHAPHFKVTYSGCGATSAMRIDETGARETIAAADSDMDYGLRVVSSKSFGSELHLAKYMAGRQVREHRHRGSSIKFCEVAEGRVDLFPRFGPSREWDTAAGQAIVEAAGGAVTTPTGDRLTYGKPDFMNANFIAKGRR